MAQRAPSLAHLLAQVDAAHPGRNKSQDGWIGDSAHAGRASDHNPNSRGMVDAQDLTDNPPTFDAWAVANSIVGDSRLNYVIHDRKINSGGGWRPYGGSSPHTEHVHLSIHQTPQAEGDTRDWNIGGVAVPSTLARPSTPGLIVVHRLYRRVENEHFLSESESEVLGLLGPHTDYEGAAWEYDPALCPIRVVRFVHNKSDLHFWSASPAEQVAVTHQDWRTEGLAFGCRASGTPVERLIHNNTGRHLWTAMKAEYEVVQHQDWRAEGIAFYV